MYRGYEPKKGALIASWNTYLATRKKEQKAAELEQRKKEQQQATK